MDDSMDKLIRGVAGTVLVYGFLCEVSQPDALTSHPPHPDYITPPPLPTAYNIGAAHNVYSAISGFNFPSGQWNLSPKR